jgi:Zn-finger protein
MKKNDSTYFKNTECKYFPCHNTSPEADFNCLFCYCPLYTLGDKCGGRFVYLEDGTKDCSACMIPHSAGGYDYVLGKYSEVAELAKKREGDK